MNSKQYTLEVGGKTLIAEFNDLAEQAHGSVMLRYDSTVVLATAVMSKEPKDSDFFPLTVEYEERFYAAGKISGGKYNKREGRPSEEAILSGRIVDRTIRPLFEQYIRNEVQVILTVLALGDGDLHILGVIGASLALATSHIPWNGPVSCIREVNDKFELVACGKDGLVNMIELGGNEISEKDANEALTKASSEIEKIQAWQKQIITEIGKSKVVLEKPKLTEGTEELFATQIEPKLKEYVFSNKISEIMDVWVKLFVEKFPDGRKDLAIEYLDGKINDLVHSEAIDNNKRADGRGLDEIRPLFAKAGGISPNLHGSGTFYRGATHVLSVLTLGGPGDELEIDGMETSEPKRFMHHYNFPPFSTGETGRVGGTNRRMIGHGALAEKALVPVLPLQKDFPYTIRIVSEAFSSNGSTSMGSVCGSTLALMDAGVPIKSPVAGIASGLMMRNEKEYKVLTDIQGPEDHHGDMDFKVAGTREGITAIQMDVKVNGIPLKILSEAFEKAKVARFQILDLIEKEIPKPRADISPKAPKILTFAIKQDQIGFIIGSGGKTIKEIKDKTLVDEITIEDDGTVFITGKNGSAEKAKAVIETLIKGFKPRR